jgi:hypothetical protein
LAAGGGRITGLTGRTIHAGIDANEHPPATGTSQNIPYTVRNQRISSCQTVSSIVDTVPSPGLRVIGYYPK